MANKLINDLTSLTSLENNDLLIVYDVSESGNEKTKKITASNAFSGLNNSKINKLVDATEGNLVEIDSDGGLRESDMSAGRLIDVLDYTGKNNFITNGSMRIWQRNHQFLSPAHDAVLADRFRWYNTSPASVSVSRVQNDDFVIGEILSTYMYINVSSPLSSVGSTHCVALYTALEGYDMVPLINQVCTLSFWSWSTVGGTYCIKFGNLGENRYLIKEYTKTAGVWEKNYVTFVMPDPGELGGAWSYTNGIGLLIYWIFACGSSRYGTKDGWYSGSAFATSNQVNALSSAGNAIFISNIKLELGDRPTRFQFLPIESELRACQRYYEKSYNMSSYPGEASATQGEEFFVSPKTGSVTYKINYKTTKAISANLVIYSPVTGASGYVRNLTTNSDVGATVILKGESSALISFSATDGHLYAFQWASDGELQIPN